MFHFRQFSLSDNGCAHKIGTDAVLLGSWAGCGDAQTILDVGTGCGLIALMLAQRSASQLIAIDVDRRSISRALENFRLSPWPERLSARCISLQEFVKGNTMLFDLLISNPPYFSESLASPSTGRNLARHDDSLSAEELVSAAVQVLSESGRLAVIIPFLKTEHLINMANRHGLLLQRKLLVSSKKTKAPVRCLIEFGKQAMPVCEEAIVLRDEDGKYSEDYRRLTREFHPGF